VRLARSGTGIAASTSVGNSREIGNLEADEVWVGVGERINGFAGLLITVFSDVASAEDGLEIQFSPDGIDWHTDDVYSIAAGAFKTFTFQPVLEWVRVMYTNGPVATGANQFHLHTAYHSVAVKPSSHRLADNVSGQDDATLQKSIVAAERPDGAYANVLATDTNRLIVQPTDALAEIPSGTITGQSSTNKFGRATNCVANVRTDVWDGSNLALNQATWVAPTGARIHTLVSTSLTDSGPGGVNPESTGAKTVRVFGLTSWDTREEFEDVVLDGTVGVATTKAYVIVHRMTVVDFGASGPNVGRITATAAVDATVTAIIEPGQGQTQMAVYGWSSLDRALMTSFYASALKGTNKAVQGNVTLYVTELVRTQPNVWTTKSTTGTTADPTRHPYKPYASRVGPAIAKIAINVDNLGDVSAGFDVILRDVNS
jgi:hypothetical protein